jgi:hypothetical protein
MPSDLQGLDDHGFDGNPILVTPTENVTGMREMPYSTRSDRFETVGWEMIEGQGQSGWSVCSGDDCDREFELRGVYC